jgi:tetratricopeptide (TPR) repeat protein
MPHTTRSNRRLILLVLPALVLGWVGWRGWTAKRLREAIAAAREDIAGARHATARRDLERLLAGHPDSAEATYLLGLCERNTGRFEAAADRWRQVPPGRPFDSQSIQGLMELELQRGRLAAAEQVVADAAGIPGSDATGLRLYLGPILSQEGRTGEAREIIAERWEHLNARGEGTSEPALNLLRLSIELGSNPLAPDEVRSFLNRAGGLAPEDDRVWLGKANLATRTGAFDEADRLLRDCERTRPTDPAVLRSRLEWAVASDRPEDGLRAFGRIAGRQLDDAEVGRLAAALFRKRGLRDREREALEFLTRAELERLRARFRRLHRRNQPWRDAAELGRLALRLGSWFEARGYATLAVEVDPDRPDGDEILRELEATLKDLKARRELLVEQVAATGGP